MRLSREALYLTLLLGSSATGCGGTVRGSDGDGDAEGAGGEGSGSHGSGGAASVDPLPPAGGRGPAHGGRPGSSGGSGGQPGLGGSAPAAGGARIDPSGCPWGDSLVCRCSDEIYGAMDCLPDGSGYTGICICEVPLSCDDGELNAAETDVDCGGGECRACPEGWGCKVDYDCLSLKCEPGGLCAGGP